jgi:hypothetical protein
MPIQNTIIPSGTIGFEGALQGTAVYGNEMVTFPIWLVARLQEGKGRDLEAVPSILELCS